MASLQTNVSRKELRYIVNHVVLPPELPQEDDSSVSYDNVLLRLVHTTAVSFASRLSADEAWLWEPIKTMLAQWTRIAQDGSIDDMTLNQALEHIGVGGM